MERASLLVLILVLSFCPACATHGSEAANSRSAPDLQKVRNSNFQDFVREFGADWGSVASFYELPWSEVRFDRLERLFDGWQERLTGVKFDALNQKGRIDYILVRDKFATDIASLQYARQL